MAEQSPIKLILEELNLSQYLDEFVGQGFDNWASISLIQNHDFRTLGVLLGHQRIIQQKIASYQPQNTADSTSVNDDLEQPETSPTASSSRAMQPTTRSRSSQASPRQPGEKRKYRRHPAPDFNAPPKPPTAYVFYCNDCRKRWKHRNLSFEESAKLAGEGWGKISVEDKARYETMYTIVKTAFDEAQGAYEHTMASKRYSEYLTEFKRKFPHAATNPRRIKRKRDDVLVTSDAYLAELKEWRDGMDSAVSGLDASSANAGSSGTANTGNGHSATALHSSPSEGSDLQSSMTPPYTPVNHVPAVLSGPHQALCQNQVPNAAGRSSGSHCQVSDTAEQVDELLHEQCRRRLYDPTRDQCNGQNQEHHLEQPQEQYNEQHRGLSPLGHQPSQTLHHDQPQGRSLFSSQREYHDRITEWSHLGQEHSGPLIVRGFPKGGHGRAKEHHGHAQEQHGHAQEHQEQTTQPPLPFLRLNPSQHRPSQSLPSIRTMLSALGVSQADPISPAFGMIRADPDSPAFGRPFGQASTAPTPIGSQVSHGQSGTQSPIIHSLQHGQSGTQSPILHQQPLRHSPASMYPRAHSPARHLPIPDVMNHTEPVLGAQETAWMAGPASMPVPESGLDTLYAAAESIESAPKRIRR